MTKGLYRIDEFKDNCGFGLAAHIKGEASHRLLEQAIESLTCMTHRGGIAADGKTGDGCGLLIQKPDEFFRAEVREKHGVELTEQYGVGSIMFGKGEQATAAWAPLPLSLCRTLSKCLLMAKGLASKNSRPS